VSGPGRVTAVPRLRGVLVVVAQAWRTLRLLTGDAAYERYLVHAGQTPLSREAFYLDSLSRRYGRPNRCC
jgi:uncharacterized short protein YbdD (DUF466 family)